MEHIRNIGTELDWIVLVVYLIAMLLFGSYFARYNKDTNDFFFGGRRFVWWLIAMSIVATGVLPVAIAVSWSGFGRYVIVMKASYY